MSVSYDYYRIFYYVSKYGSFTRAASILMNSQPNITRTIANLEKELDCRLFLRTNRGVTLTPEGKKLFAHVEIAHEQLQNGELELASEKNLQTGSISIGVSETALQAVLLPVLQRFRRRYPGVRFRITNHSTAQAVASLKSGLVEHRSDKTAEGISPDGISGCADRRPPFPQADRRSAKPERSRRISADLSRSSDEDLSPSKRFLYRSWPESAAGHHRFHHGADSSHGKK